LAPSRGISNSVLLTRPTQGERMEDELGGKFHKGLHGEKSCLRTRVDTPFGEGGAPTPLKGQKNLEIGSSGVWGRLCLSVGTSLARWGKEPKQEELSYPEDRSWALFSIKSDEEGQQQRKIRVGDHKPPGTVTRMHE